MRVETPKEEYEQLYDRWTDRILSQGISVIKSRDQELWYIIARRLLQGKYVTNALEIGCGTGLMTFRLRKYSKHQYGIDIAKGATRITRRVFGADTINADALNLPFSSNRFGLIVSLETIEHLPSWQQGLKEMLRVLTPAGSLIITFPNVLNPIGMYLRFKFDQPIEKSLHFWNVRKELQKLGAQIVKRTSTWKRHVGIEVKKND